MVQKTWWNILPLFMINGKIEKYGFGRKTWSRKYGRKHENRKYDPKRC